MEIRIIDDASRENVRLPNEPFALYGRMIPTFDGEKWDHTIWLCPEEQISEMCFPDENYDYEAMKANTVFLGAYEKKTCIGLALLQDPFFKYLYLYDLKVRGQYRRHGVGTALIERAGKIALAKGCRGIYTVAQDNNLSACKFYLKNGFQIGGFDNRVYTGTSQEGKADIVFYLDCI